MNDKVKPVRVVEGGQPVAVWYTSTANTPAQTRQVAQQIAASVKAVIRQEGKR